ncbi:hypothetical protein CCP2SC5_920019 [Azospirillaceae bacterium]
MSTDFRGNERKPLTKSDILNGAQGATDSRFIGNNTVEYYIENGRFIRLHTTDILVFSGDSIRISSGGWQTRTTKERINKYLPQGYRLFSEDGFWFISHAGSRFPFKDGMVIDLKNNTADSGNYHKALTAFKLEKKNLTYFVEKYAAALHGGTLPLPGAGDCFICQIAANNPDYKNYDHIQSHIDEFYLVPELIWAACRSTGNEYYLRYVQEKPEKFSKNDIKRILRKYFKQQKAVAD